MERKAWHCPGCGKVHAPHVDTCPETLGVVTVPTIWPVLYPAYPPTYPYPYAPTWISTGTAYSTAADEMLTLTNMPFNEAADIGIGTSPRPYWDGITSN
jgi:hypothetical protein